MKKFIYILTFGLLNGACDYDLDTYQQPSTSIFGEIIDAGTNENIQHRSNGLLSVRLLEQSFDNPAPMDLTVTQEGSFKSERIFEGLYEAYPFNGPFSYLGEGKLFDTQLDNGRIDFEVLPYCRIKIIDLNDNKVDYVVEKTEVAPDVLQQVIIMYNTYGLVDEVVTSNSNTGNNYTLDVGDEILGIKQTFELPWSTSSSDTIYLRIGARIKNESWNYSPIIPINSNQ